MPCTPRSAYDRDLGAACATLTPRVHSMPVNGALILSLSHFPCRALPLLLVATLLSACGADAPPAEPVAPPMSEAELEAANRALVEALDPRERAFTVRFEMRSDGTAIDSTTGLMWMRCAFGQVWQAGSCADEPKLLSWNQTIKATQGFVFAGYGDWRLPTRDELVGLVYCSSGVRRAPDPDGVPGTCEGDYRAPTLLSAVFPNAPVHKFWSGTQDERHSFAAWGVSFVNGATGVGVRTDYVLMRLVRSTTDAARQD